MATTERDLELIQEELRCLRQRFRSTVSTAGGAIPDGSLSVPGSSVFPDSYFEDCECAGINVVNPDPIDICPPTENGLAALGDLAGVTEDDDEPLDHGIYVFDAIVGVYYRDSDTDSWDSRNTGLSDITLNHGIVDAWWKSRTDGNSSTSAILWTCGNGFVRRSVTGGLGGWTTVTPTSTVSDLTYVQVYSDPFKKKRFYTVGFDESTRRSFLYKTEDDGQTWEEVELTTFNSATQRIPIWLTLSGNGGESIFLTTWHTDGSTPRLDIVKITASTLAALTSISLGDTTKLEYDNIIYIGSPATALDDEALVYIYGRMENPDGLGLAHIIKSEDGGATYSVEESSWGTDWAGSMVVSLEDSGGDHNYYAVRNSR